MDERRDGGARVCGVPQVAQISLTERRGFVICRLRADPCSVRIQGVYLKEPIPVLREDQALTGRTCLPAGSLDASNDLPT